jgi:hypothetical protein
MELAMAEIAARGGHPNTALPAGGHSPLVVLGAALLVSGAALAMVRARRLHPTA